MTVRPRSIRLEPIDDVARNGRHQLVFGVAGGREQFAVARWVSDSWCCTSGAQLPFEPESYQP